MVLLLTGACLNQGQVLHAVKTVNTAGCFAVKVSE